MPSFYHNWQNERVTTNSNISLQSMYFPQFIVLKARLLMEKCWILCHHIFLCTWPLIVLYLNTAALQSE